MFFNPFAYNLYNHKLPRKPCRPLSGNPQCPKKGKRSDRVKSTITGLCLCNAGETSDGWASTGSMMEHKASAAMNLEAPILRSGWFTTREAPS